MSAHKIHILIVYSLLMFVGCGCAGTSNQYSTPYAPNPKYETASRDLAYSVEFEVRTKYPMITDADEISRMQRIIDRLQTHALRNYIHSRVHIIATPTYANSCTGGNDIFIGQRLIDELVIEDRIAFVLAHEIVHIDQYHGIRTLKHATKSKWTTFGVTKGMQVGLAFVPGVGAASPAIGLLAPTAIGVFNNVVADIVHKGYRRSFEYEADEGAVQLMMKAGYDPQAAVQALCVLSALKQRSEQKQAPPIVSTHPSLEKRIKHLETVEVLST